MSINPSVLDKGEPGGVRLILGLGLGLPWWQKKCQGLEFGGGASYLGSGDLMGWGKPRLSANGSHVRGE